MDKALTDQIMFGFAPSEKDTAATTMENHLCRMVPARKDLAVHGLEGDIRHGGNVNKLYLTNVN